MKVRELIDELEKFDQDSEVYLSSDPEGNGYYSLYQPDSYYIRDDESGIQILSEEDLEDEAEKYELPIGVVLWP